jgi:circadian clock protein KaiC
MTTERRGTIKLLPTGVPGLDDVLMGGLPEYSLNLITGEPGSGKTTLAQQIAFSLGTKEAPAIYFTVLGEPPLKMLRHVQTYSFYDEAKIGTAVRFVNLSAEGLTHDLDRMLERILAEVEEVRPSVVIVDSFRTVARASGSELALQDFVQKLAIHLTSSQATTFLVGEIEYGDRSNPTHTISDGLFQLTQSIERNACVRRLQVVKMRGLGTMAGLHTFVMSSDGIRVLPRVLPPSVAPPPDLGDAGQRASSGVAGLDAMMGGGIPRGASAMFVGPSGTGKSTFARQFIARGAEAGERGILVVFEGRPGEYLGRARSFGPKLEPLVARHLVEVVSLRSLDLTVDEALAEIRSRVERLGARRVAIDSLSEFELALTPSHREDFRESLFRTISSLNGLGVTVVMTADLVQSFTELGLSSHIIDFLTDVLVLLRYVELEGALEKVLAIVKMRGGAHDRGVRRYELDASGIVLSPAAPRRGGLLTGLPLVRAELPPALESITRRLRWRSRG